MLPRLCLGSLALREAVGARHDGLLHQLYPLLPVMCHGSCLCEGFGAPLRDVVSAPLLRPASSSHAFDCSLKYTLVMPSDLVTC